MKRIDRRKLISLLILAAFFIGGYLLSAWLEENNVPADDGTAYIDTTAASTTDEHTDDSAPFDDRVQGADTQSHNTQEDASADDDVSTVTDDVSQAPSSETDRSGDSTDTPAIDENGIYTSRDDVALYLHIYGRLPDNFITKDEASALGWSGGGLENYAPGCCIGGDKFGNREGLLPKADGRQYYECDIDTLGQNSRGAKRIVYSNDGLIFYTDDHYESFTQLYGKQ